ncbi:hypothetical protein [Aestuariispira insulae]|uniref:DUF1835 domain-containing protein n=1 Tax=Aestuariispira insulae TaxID=1461337 RepID=A0A3D9H6G3_9PROT|nr:hypothetical protein [Aestuariispira insulae]RED45107.1 hypothetical protein DFP90_112100 [Aestuariispira insulae]
MNWLHVTNGDGASDLIKHSTVPGDVLPWRDVMHHGPFPADKSLEALAEIRGGYLAGEILDRREVIVGFTLRDAHFQGAGRYDELVLWFEHDLLDQLQLVQILDLISKLGLRDETTVSLICIGEYPGIEPFRGLGQLTLEQAAGLMDQRRTVSESQIALARSAWAAFCGDDPLALQNFLLKADFSPLPYLKPCLERQLQEFPWISDGLTRSERQFLQLVADGTEDPARLFMRNMDFETHLFMGDWQSFVILERLCMAEFPLLTCQPTPFRYPPKDEIELEDFRAQRLLLSDHGRAVLAGQKRAGIKRDDWMGGVHLSGPEAAWQWDPDGQRLIRAGI